MPRLSINALITRWRPIVNVTGWLLIIWGLFWLTMCSIIRSNMLPFQSSQPAFERFPYWLIWLTVALLIGWISRAVLGHRGYFLKWPLFLLSCCSTVMILLIVSWTKSLGPFFSGCVIYRQITDSIMCEPRFDRIRFYYLLALLFANMILIITIPFEKLSDTNRKGTYQPDILDNIEL